VASLRPRAGRGASASPGRQRSTGGPQRPRAGGEGGLSEHGLVGGGIAPIRRIAEGEVRKREDGGHARSRVRPCRRLMLLPSARQRCEPAPRSSLAFACGRGRRQLAGHPFPLRSSEQDVSGGQRAGALKRHYDPRTLCRQTVTVPSPGLGHDLAGPPTIVFRRALERKTSSSFAGQFVSALSRRVTATLEPCRTLSGVPVVRLRRRRDAPPLAAA
jgi:hypothetical protein